MTPSETIIATATEARAVVDALGRRLSLRSPTALDKLRLLKAAGPELAMNQAWLSMAVLAISVTAIDDVPVPRPATEGQIEALVGRLGDSGIDAIAEAMISSADVDQTLQVVNAGNLPGTPT